MTHRFAWLFTLLMVAEAILVNGRPPRFPASSRDAVEWTVSIERRTESRPH